MVIDFAGAVLTKANEGVLLERKVALTAGKTTSRLCSEIKSDLVVINSAG